MGNLAASLTVLTEAVGELDVRTPAGEPVETARLAAWPLALLPERGEGWRLRYLVYPEGPVDRALSLLDGALSALAKADGAIVVPEAVPDNVWRALGGVPRPAVLVDVPAVTAAPPRPDVPTVLAGLRIGTVALRPLVGRVLAVGGAPLAGVRVEVAGAGRWTRTDARGGFAFHGVPASAATRLLLSVRGRQLTADVDTSSAEPVVVHCDPVHFDSGHFDSGQLDSGQLVSGQSDPKEG